MANASAKINNNYKRAYGGDLCFPSDTGQMERTGHYVQFFINVQEKSQVQFPGGDFNTRTNATSTAATEASTLYVTRAATKRLAATIQLYMPNKLSVDAKATYGDAEIGAGLGVMASAANVVGNVFSPSTWSLTGAVSSVWGGIKSAARSAAGAVTSAVGSVTPGMTGAKDAMDIKLGTIKNNRTEMKFEGIDRRTFSFSFKMMPRNEQETENIKNIVNLFRFHSMPEFLGAVNNSRTLLSPSTFDIKYIAKGEENAYMNKISTCVLEGVTVEYGGDRTQFFKNNAPTETSLTLNFKELEIITKERIKDGY